MSLRASGRNRFIRWHNLLDGKLSDAINSDRFPISGVNLHQTDDGHLSLKFSKSQIKLGGDYDFEILLTNDDVAKLMSFMAMSATFSQMIRMLSKFVK